MIILKCNAYLKRSDFEQLKQDIKEQASAGTLILPPYIDLVGVSEDSDIIVLHEDIADEQ